MFQICLFLPCPAWNSLSKEPGLFQWGIVLRKPVLGTSGGEGVPSYENIAAPCSFFQQTQLGYTCTCVGVSVCFYTYTCLLKTLHSHQYFHCYPAWLIPVFPFMFETSFSDGEKGASILHKIFNWPNQCPSVTADPSLRFWHPGASPTPPPPQYPSLHTGWAAEALPPTPAFLSSACCFYKKCFSFPKCLCFHPLCLSTLVAACVFATRWWAWPGEQALQVCTGEWVEGAVVDTVRGAFGAPRRSRGLHLKANRPGLQRSVAGGWSCDPSDGVGTASVVRGCRLSLPTGWLLSLLSLPVCELFWNRFNESWWT